MTQSLDLNKMGLTSMNEFEMMEVEGGSFWKSLFVGLSVAFAAVITVSTLGGVALFAGAVYAGTQIEPVTEEGE